MMIKELERFLIVSLTIRLLSDQTHRNAKSASPTGGTVPRVAAAPRAATRRGEPPVIAEEGSAG